jgi:hypothetical protein
MTTQSAATLRNRVQREIGQLLDQLPEPERFYVLLRCLLRMNPDAIPLKPDGRRMSSEEAKRRVAMHKDRQVSMKADAR